MQDKGGSDYQFRIDTPSPEVNGGKSMKSTGQSQASGPVTTGRRRPLGRDRIGGFVWSKREREPLQPIAALVTKVLDDEPTMAEDWP
jgi:hypothetical protein